MKNKWKEVSVHGTQTRQSKEDEEGSKEVNKETKDCKTKKIKTERRPLRRPLFYIEVICFLIHAHEAFP